MQKTRASIRYAKALFELALENTKTKEVLNDLITTSELINTEEGLNSIITNPTIKQKQKEKLFRKLFESSIDRLTMSFMILVIRKGRESIFVEIANKYKGLYNLHNNISVVDVVSATVIRDDLKKRIKEKTSFRGGEVQLNETIDKKLLGGFIIKRGDLQYDASIRKKLNNAKRAFKL